MSDIVSCNENELLLLDMSAKLVEPCSDTISRQAVNEIINDIRDCISVEGYWAIIERMKKLPSANPQPKIGKWIKHDTGHSIYYDCSRCSCIAPCTETADRWLWKLSNYCPDCGAKMENHSRVEDKKNDF